MMITSWWYDRLRWVAQLLLPAMGVLYFLLADPWGLGSVDVVLGTIVVVDLALGVFLAISQASYAKRVGLGDLIVERDERGVESLRLALDHTPDELVDKEEVRFKVKRERPQLEAVS